MIEHVSRHRFDERQIIDHLAHVRQEGRYPGPRLAVPCKLAHRPQELGMFFGKDIHERESAALDERIGDGLAAVFLELRLVIEKLELAGPSGHEEINHALGTRRVDGRDGPRAGLPRLLEHGSARATVIGESIPFGHRVQGSLAFHERGQSHRTQPDAAIGEEMAPRAAAKRAFVGSFGVDCAGHV